MELRHLRYFQAVAEVLNFTKAAMRLRVAQPALSRQVQDLEDELGVDLLKRSPRGVTLTPEGRLFLTEVRELLKRADESVEKVRALARGELGELHVGYAPSPTLELLPPALAAFRETAPLVRVVLHDLAGDELSAGLREGRLELALMVQPTGASAMGIQFELLRRSAIGVVMPAKHPFSRLKSVSLEQVASKPLVGLSRREYSDYCALLEQIFAPSQFQPRVAVECDSSSSIIAEVEAGRGVAVVSETFQQVAGRRLVFRLLSGTPVALHVGIARATNGDLTPAGEKFCEVVRQIAAGTQHSKHSRRERKPTSKSKSKP